jgi:phage/plasmid-associated DNA primase
MYDCRINLYEEWKDILNELNKEDPDEKKLYEEILAISTFNSDMKLDNPEWLAKVVKQAIIKLRDDDREKLMNQTKSEIAVPPCHILIIKTEEIRERNPEDNWSIELPISYSPKHELDNEKDNAWKTFLNQITLGNKVMSRNLRDICGSILLGSGSNGALTIIEGNDDSGKDILLDAIEYTMGKFMVEGSRKPFISNNEIAGKVSDIEAFRNCRYLRISDLEFSDKLNDDYIKIILREKK